MRKYFKLLTLVVLLPLTCSIVSAQNESFRIKGGLNLSTLNTDNSDNSYKAGYMAGFSYLIPLVSNFSVQPEVLFSTFGSKAEFKNTFAGLELSNGQTDFRLDYIDIPVLLSYSVTDNLHFNLGPYAAILLNAKSETTAEILNSINITSSDDLDEKYFNKVDYGVVAGLELNFAPVFAGVDYKIGINPVAKQDDDLAETLLKDSKNRVIQVYVGIQF
ncbi:porin family protein [Saccharicrinis sp. FJH2]|uniref:porin family protein n=1 Tax=Saccharicrinis sp. FJH65 TaxID=3344659 RepID=UPI0035F4948E